MGWNGSNSGSGAVVKDGGRKPSAKAAPSFKKGIIAGLIVIIGAGLAAFIIGRGGSPSRPQSKKATKGLIEEVKPQIVTQAVEQVVETPKPKPRKPMTEEERREGLARIRNGEVKRPQINMDTYRSPDPGFSARWARHQEEQAKLPFKHMSENEISVVLDTKPGDMILDTAFHPAFERDFLESLKTPIVINPDDPPELVEQKQQMIEAKKVLKAAYDNGESITDILREERENLQKAYRLRENLMETVRSVERGGASDEEIETSVEAANKMLDEYGARHIRLPYRKSDLQINPEEKGNTP